MFDGPEDCRVKLPSMTDIFHCDTFWKKRWRATIGAWLGRVFPFVGVFSVDFSTSLLFFISLFVVAGVINNYHSEMSSTKASSGTSNLCIYGSRKCSVYCRTTFATQFPFLQVPCQTTSPSAFPFWAPFSILQAVWEQSSFIRLAI